MTAGSGVCDWAGHAASNAITADEAVAFIMPERCVANGSSGQCLLFALRRQSANDP